MKLHFFESTEIDRIVNSMRGELVTAQRRLDVGEPFNTTAAEMGLVPGELVELLYHFHYFGNQRTGALS